MWGGLLDIKPIYYEAWKKNVGGHGILYPRCLKSGGTLTPCPRPNCAHAFSVLQRANAICLVKPLMSKKGSEAGNTSQMVIAPAPVLNFKPSSCSFWFLIWARIPSPQPCDKLIIKFKIYGTKLCLKNLLQVKHMSMVKQIAGALKRNVSMQLTFWRVVSIKLW